MRRGTKRVRYWLLILFACLTVLLGCGGSGDAEADIERSVRDYWEATAQGDGATACAAATGDHQGEILGEEGLSTGEDLGCAERVEATYAEFGADNFATLADFEITNVQVEDDEARVTHEADGVTCVEPLEKIGDEWRIAGDCER
jgi:hypothetical protein